ncbi:hypothetical protein FOA52_001430 [Chlamydomonas sp. UWO 241]|nr:hypothetical protein FOA52_001430 [Chlamydomonas sp. UWO 241]
MSGMVLEFSGCAVGKDISGIAKLDAKKTFPPGVYFLLLEGCNENKFDGVSHPTSPVFRDFLFSMKGAPELVDAMTDEIKASCKGLLGFNFHKVGELVYGKYADIWRPMGVDLVLNKLIVNLGMPAFREFMWLEFSIDPAYESATQARR